MNEATWLAMLAGAAFAMAAHWLMKYYHLCVSGWHRIGRYAAGILSIAVPLGVWYWGNQDATGCDVIVATTAITAAVGGATILAYAWDVARERDILHAEAKERGFGTD